MGKLSNTLWKAAGVGADKLAEIYGTTLGKKYVEEVIFKSRAEKKIKKLQDQNKLTEARQKRMENALQAKKDYDDFKKRERAYNKSKELERNAEYRELKADAKELASKARDSFKKVVTPPSYSRVVDPNVSFEERERRRKLYGPGGTAYR